MLTSKNAKLASRDNAQLFWWALALGAASVLVTGYRVYFHNQALQIPLIRLLKDPTLYPGDPFAATLPYYASTLWRVVVWCARIIPLEPLLLGLFLLERFLVIYAAGSLALTLAPRSRLCMVATMAFFATAPVPILGGGTILMPYFEQTSLAVGFFMMATAAFYSRRPIAWAVWLAAGFNCNSMYGVYAITYFAAAFITRMAERRGSDAPRSLSPWIRALGLFALLSTPAIVLSLGAFGKGGVDTHLWFMACRARVPHHIFPSTWAWSSYARFALLMLVVAYGVTRSDDLRKRTLPWMAVGAAWVLIAALAEWVRSPSLMILQPARATDLWYCFGVIALMSACLANRRPMWLMALALIPFALFHTTGNGAAGEGLLAIGGPHWALTSSPSIAMRQVCDWASGNTPKDAAFLVSPNWGEFRGLSMRPAFVTWKDGSALLWCRPFAVPWSQRMAALGYDVTKGKLPGRRLNSNLDRLYDSLTDSDAQRLASHYGIRYWAVKTDHTSALPVVYANRRFKVLNVRRG